MKNPSVAGLVATLFVCVSCDGSTVRVMNTGLGDGRVVSAPGGIDCTDNCAATFARDATVRLTAAASRGSVFVGWSGDCTGSLPECLPTPNGYRSVIARFLPIDSLPALSDDSMLKGQNLRSFIVANPRINTPFLFIAALRRTSHRFQDNWILMSKSESLQTGTATSPRLLLPSQNSEHIFAFSLTRDAAFPHSDPDRIEYIEFDPPLNRFRFHEINVGAGTVTVDATTCFECHAGRPNWDSYDNWGGMLPYNRDRIYKGSLEAAALRSVFNLWGHTGEQRRILEQLNLPPGMERVPTGGISSGRIRYPAFDGADTVYIEPRVQPGMVTTVPLTREESNWPTSGPRTPVYQRGDTIVLRNTGTIEGDEGRGVDLFDQLTALNARRVAQNLTSRISRFVDARPIALAIARGCALENSMTRADSVFFNTRNRVDNFAAMVRDTRARQKRLPELKADLQYRNLTDVNGLIQAYGSQTPQGRSTNDGRVRQELFRRPLDNDAREETHETVPLLPDIESYSSTPVVARYRYFLEPLGVDVDKWSLSVHGRSRTYTFADLLSVYNGAITAELNAPLGFAGTAGCTPELQRAVGFQFSRLPATVPTPTFADVQRIFNRNCLECHGSFRTIAGSPYEPILVGGLSYAQLVPRRVVAGDTARSLLFLRLKLSTSPMPPTASGPSLSGADLDVIRRWIQGGAPRS